MRSYAITYSCDIMLNMNKGMTQETFDNLPYWIFVYEETLSCRKASKICGVGYGIMFMYLKRFGIINPDNVRLAKIGKANPKWVEKPSYNAVHGWVKRNKHKPSQCDDCGLDKRLDLANISQLYLRDINDWEWLCRRCHMLKDGRMDNLKQYSQSHE